MNDLKDLILKYQKSPDDKDTFAELIYNADYLIVHFIKVCRKRLPYLRGEDPRDLYNDGIIALSRAALTFPAGMKSEYIPCRLRSYMIIQYRTLYRYIGKENVELDQGDYGKHNTTHEIDLDKIDYDAIMKLLSPEEAELVEDFLSGKKTGRQLAKEHGVSAPRISGKIKQIVGRLKK